MITDFDKILNELSYRVKGGSPDLKNEQHLIKLFDVLKEFNWPIEARVELIQNLTESNKENLVEIDDKMLKHKLKNPTTGNLNQVSTLLGKRKSDRKAYDVAKNWLGDQGVSDDDIEKQSEKSTDDSDGIRIKSPIIGTAYLAVEPGAKKFVEVGDKIKKGQTVMIVEAMKTMNHVPSTADGEVKKILIEDGQPVEFGQTLVILK